MSEYRQKKSNNSILIIANNDVGLYNFRRDLIETILKSGYSVYISLPDGDMVDNLEKIGCFFINTDIDRRGMNPLRDLVLLWRYSRILHRIKPDMVITYTIKPNIYGGIACRLARIPYAVNITGLGSAIENGGLLRKLVLALYKPALKKARKIFFENASNCSVLSETGVVPDGCAVVMNGAGVNLSEYPYQPYQEHETVRFLFAGRVMREKGVDELFEAAKNLKSEFGDKVEFHFVGSFEEDYRQTMDELEHSGIVKYHGYQQDMKPFYAMADCVVLPSYHEGMSNVLLEAAASGCPLIVSDIPGCREAVEDGVNGYLCKPMDAASLQAAMERFTAQPNSVRTEMGRRGREYMQRCFNRDDVVKKTIQCLGIIDD